ncbi:Olfactory receptor 7D4 [Sciurus carolinensis]|uniref:Olfactory receptor 7D4 n=1 Tax=Sciurus carolinensis TaxID=30640 RepID=A0AA41SV45_SCICA|nr:Olfactory receptor 7D4 [Sciurus carolinensis]
MEVENHTVLSQFLLLGLSEDPELQLILFGLFLSMYLVTVLGNLLIILTVSSDSHLHTPMNFFLCNLSLIDICFTPTIIPKMLNSFCEVAQLFKVASSDALIGIIVMYVSIALLLVFPVAGILHSYSQIVSTLARMSSSLSKYKAFSTCGSHLCLVSLFYGTELGVYLSSAVTHSPQESSIASVMYTVVAPMLNPFIYSLRDKDMKGALGRLLSRAASYS